MSAKDQARDPEAEDPLHALRLLEADLEAAKTISTVGRLLKEYDIPTQTRFGRLDLQTRLFYLVIALAETHPSHRELKKKGAKSKWGPWSWAALLIEIDRLLASGVESQTAAAQHLATTQPWAGLLKGNEGPGQSLRQEYIKANRKRKIDDQFCDWVQMVKKYAPEATSARKRYITNLVRGKVIHSENCIDFLLSQAFVNK